MTHQEETQAMRIVNLRIQLNKLESVNFKLEDKITFLSEENIAIKEELETAKKFIEVWKYSNSKLCQKLDQVDEELQRTKNDLFKLRNS